MRREPTVSVSETRCDRIQAVGEAVGRAEEKIKRVAGTYWRLEEVGQEVERDTKWYKHLNEQWEKKHKNEMWHK